jgi:hypothetical protein
VNNAKTIANTAKEAAAELSNNPKLHWISTQGPTQILEADLAYHHMSRQSPSVRNSLKITIS